ncbi:MAG: T9SS type A sorting domain-containing protein [Saprospirales bacterium]|nr:T9SS type A sorting domain-containing protein [Saprospirales bacterium]
METAEGDSHQEVVDVATIGNSPTSIYNYLTNYYHTQGLTYVLLVGDETTLATMQTPVNNACDHCYSYQDGNDHFNEFFVGRFNAENAAQLQTMVDRTLEYEKNPDMTNPEWFRTGIGSGSSQGPGDDSQMDFEHINAIKTDMLAYTYGAVYEFYDGNQSASSPTPGSVTTDGTGNPQNTAIGNVVNSGASIYNYCGHGSHEALSSGNFNVTTVHNHLTNVGMYPFLIAVACCVGDFQNDFGSGECLGDAWIRATDAATGKPAGGIGGLFSSILQSWSPPMEGQDEMNLLIVEAGEYNIRHTMGGIAIHGFGAMIEDYGGGGEEMADTWGIFGDPSVVLWTDTPADMVVSHVAAVNVGTSQLQVLCDVEDALVGLFYQGNILGSGLVSGGVANISFDPVVEPEQILVTVTAFNHMPYQGPVDVIVSQGPYVILSSHQLDDAAGNNNQLADYGENILMNLTLENVGPVLAPNVSATLSTGSSDITITQNQALYGDIAESSEVTQNGAFAFKVADFIADQAVVLFDIALNSDGVVWNYTVPVTLHAPKLEAQSEFDLADDLAGNGNGRMDQGETVKMIISVKNAGHSATSAATGALTTDNPYVTILNPSFDLGSLSENGGTAEAVFDLEIAPEVPMMTAVEFQFSVQAGDYGDDEIYNSAINLIVEDFENGLGEEFNWFQLSASQWFLTPLAPYEGESCLQSGAIGNVANTQLVMGVQVLEPGELRFARRVSSEEGWDYLRFFINGDLKEEWSGEQPWEEMAGYAVQAGNMEFMWSYEKDEFYESGEDAAWIDNIILPLILLPEDTISGTKEHILAGNSFSVFPNPSRTVAQVKFRLEQSAYTSLVLYNAHGQQVQTVYEGDLQAGAFVKSFSVEALPSGVYWLACRAGEEVMVLKVVR